MKIGFFKSFILSLAFSLSTVSLFALPDGYGPVKLGMDVDSVKEALKKNQNFGYRGDRDVSLTPITKDILIETDGANNPYSFFGRCTFQFVDDKLATISISLNPERIDHYSVFSKLCEKYGNPASISPAKSQWSDDSVIFSLERPLTLKYMDAKVFEDKQKASHVNKTYSEQLRDEFLEGL